MRTKVKIHNKNALMILYIKIQILQIQLSFRIGSFKDNSINLHLKIANSERNCLILFKIKNLNQNRSKIQNWFGIMGIY